MSNVTVDPEMKVRIMAAVSAAIREHPEQTVVTDIFDEEDEPPVRRKARKTPIIVISSIAAGILVLAGVFFVMRGLGSEKMASTEGFRYDSASKNVNYEASETAADTIGYEINAYVDERSDIYSLGIILYEMRRIPPGMLTQIPPETTRAVHRTMLHPPHVITDR